MTDEQWDEVLAFVREHTQPAPPPEQRILPEHFYGVGLFLHEGQELKLISNDGSAPFIEMSHEDYADMQRRIGGGSFGYVGTRE